MILFCIASDTLLFFALFCIVILFCITCDTLLFFRLFPEYMMILISRLNLARLFGICTLVLRSLSSDGMS